MTLGLSRFALVVTAGAALLAACAGSHSIGAPASPSARAVFPLSSSYEVVHRFGHHRTIGRDRGGAQPKSGLVDVNGTLYGTTETGGLNDAGTVYSIRTSGVKKTLYRFTSQPNDGADPVGDLLNVNGTLYGVTFNAQCGSHTFCSTGTVYSVTPSGVETVLHTFDSGGDQPTAGLIDVSGTLYGTTSASDNGCGTAYSITTAGYFKVIHAFGGRNDACEPFSALLNVKGTLYGTSAAGGVYCQGNFGCGTFFSLTPSGTDNVVFSFDGSDGWFPTAALIDVKGTLYGTTLQGGNSPCSFSCGVVYSVTTNGKEQVLYRFTGGNDGAYPDASLLEMNGALYGTASNGGSAGHGVLFSVSTSGGEQVLHSFGSTSGDGADPRSDLTEVNGMLFGTTHKGGAASGCNGAGCGTVFALSP